ncbi:MAG: CDP-diacylglycerol--glycerol-3-phosphate 3-phosphatidyltransferase [Nitrospirae bacterium]|nr:CDP-diacylglycerol--glycerol-3-phosphate 3-phosphatidyltransferase [Nitrospirota bacterium]
MYQGNPLLNVPTTITLIRILLIPVFILVAYSMPLLGASIFAIASVTDALDGYIARKSKQVTKLGVILDPIADKLLVISALIVLVDMGPVPAWMAIVIIVREFLVTGLRLVALSKDIVIPAESGGKIKTVLQIASIIVLLIPAAYTVIDLYDIGMVLLWGAMLIGIISGIQYFVLFSKKM